MLRSWDLGRQAVVVPIVIALEWWDLGIVVVFVIGIS